jgi:uncharacterized membrane protein
MAFCQNCGSPVEGRYCPKCGAATGVDPGPQTGPTTEPPPLPPFSAPGLSDNLVAALCYIPIIGLVFLLLEPYSRNRLIRFHAIQSLLLVAAMWLVSIVISSVFGIIGGGFYWAFYPIIRLAFFAVLVYAAIQAYKGRKIVLPVIGPLAENWA